MHHPTKPFLRTLTLSPTGGSGIGDRVNDDGDQLIIMIIKRETKETNFVVLHIETKACLLNIVYTS